MESRSRTIRLASVDMTDSFHGDLGRNLGAMANLDRVIDEVRRTHAGQPKAVVRAALEEAITGAGAHPDPKGVETLVCQISAGS
jgi:hypothetical protein